jgi:diguanylate cyclase (GGDEF)-like protein
MRKTPSDELGSVLAAIENAWMQGSELSGQPPGGPEHKARLFRLLDEVLEVQNFALSLSKGDLAQQLHAKGLMASSLKSLQANLRHLCWQTQMVAKGDFSQRVFFMGEFSEFFNVMIASLAQAHDQIKRREAELLQSNANLQARNREITLINKMSDALQSCLSWKEAYPIIVNFTQELFFMASGALFVLDSDQQVLKPVASWGTFLPDAPESVSPDCWAIRHNAVYLGDASGEMRSCCHLSSQLEGFSACLPLQAQEKIMGLLRLRAAGKIPSETIDQLTILAKTVRDQLSLALANIRLRETLQHQAIHDPLTGLFNRRHLVETLDRELRRAQRKNATLVVMMLDLDHFKRFNDTYGHEAGDYLLQILGEFFKSRIRGGDIAYRYGGEEFVFVLPEIPREVALIRAEEFRRGVSQLEVNYRGQRLESTTISLGVAVFPQDGTTTDNLLRSADKALYRAKAAGRNLVMAAAEK